LGFSQQFRLGKRIIRVAEPGQLSDSVNVWGDVNSPGRYLVPLNTTLPEIISYAYGPETRTTLRSQLSWTKRRIEIDISQHSPAKGKEIVTHFEYKPDQPIPAGMRNFKIKNNQVISIQLKRPPAFKDYIGIIATVICAVGTGVLLVLKLACDKIRSRCS